MRLPDKVIAVAVAGIIIAISGLVAQQMIEHPERIEPVVELPIWAEVLIPILFIVPVIIICVYGGCPRKLQ